MTAIELFEQITNEPKWYVGFTSASNASNIKKRFNEKELSFDTLTKMFNHYGYYLTASWDKKICDHTYKNSDNGVICDKCGYKPYINGDI